MGRSNTGRQDVKRTAAAVKRDRREAARMRAHGMTQEQIAKSLGVEQPTVSRWLKEWDRTHQNAIRKTAVYASSDCRFRVTASDVKTGQWWQLGEHLLYCGDSSSDEFVTQCKGASFAFADPPYNAGKAAWDQDFTWDHDYLTDAATIVAVTPGISAIPGFIRSTAMPYRWSMAAWITNGMTRGALGFGNWIYIAVFSAAEKVHRGIQDHVRLSVRPEADSVHESRKPVELLLDLLSSFTAPGDIVIDPFLGSGTTLFAAQQGNRKCIGAELDLAYCAEIITRYGPEARPL